MQTFPLLNIMQKMDYYQACYVAPLWKDIPYRLSACATVLLKLHKSEASAYVGNNSNKKQDFSTKSCNATGLWMFMVFIFFTSIFLHFYYIYGFLFLFRLYLPVFCFSHLFPPAWEALNCSRFAQVDLRRLLGLALRSMALCGGLVASTGLEMEWFLRRFRRLFLLTICFLS